MNKIFKLSTIILTSIHCCFAQLCDYPAQIDYIHVNNVRAATLNSGDNFWDLDGGNGKYQVPYTGAKSPASLYAIGLWITGYDQDSLLRGSAITYRRRSECGYYPGPVFKDNNRPTPEDIDHWNKIFSVHQQDILTHIEDAKDGQIDRPLPSIYGWPAKGNVFFKNIHGFDLELGAGEGAYFQEVAGAINGIYEPQLGEYPQVEGLDPASIPGEIKWCVYNNNDLNLVTQSQPMGFEIHQTVFAMSCDDPILSNSIFIRYKIYNTSDINYSNLKMAQWTDVDLGCFTDDYIGCLPELNTFYVYNKDSTDEICKFPTPGYTGFLPVQTITFLNQKMDSYMYYQTGPTYDPFPAVTSPNILREFNHYMDAKWRDGTPLTKGRGGFKGSNEVTRFAFPDPPTDTSGWSMAQVKFNPEDIKVIGSISRPTFNTGDIWTIDMAFTYHNDQKSNNLEMVNYAASQIPLLQQMYEDGLPDCAPDDICDCDCVWSGDADHNGHVDYLDMINVIRGLGQSGVARKGPIAWIGESVSDWSSSSPDGINYKYADVNGDGIIDSNDLNTVQDFIGNVNLCDLPPTSNCLEGSVLTWQRGAADSMFTLRRTKVPTLILNTNEAFEGLSYEIQYDHQLLKYSLANDSLEWSNEQAGISKEWRTNNDPKTILGILQFNTSKSNVPLKNNQIRTFYFRGITAPDSYPTPYAEIKICNAKMYFTDGSYKDLPAQSLKYYFDDSVKVSNKDLLDDSFVRIYPNPVHDAVHIVTDMPYATVRLINVDGIAVWSQNIIPSQSTIDVSNLPSGVYIVFIESKGLVYTKKIIIQR